MATGAVEREEDEPSEINTKNHPHFVDVHKDKLTVTYVGKGNHTDFGSVQSDVPAPTNRLIYYFEVTVLDPGLRGSITVGLSDKSFLLNRQPGWEANSYGYRGEDGKKFVGSSRGEPYGPSFGKGDVVGCGIHYLKQYVFFTRNGVNLGNAGSLGSSPEYYPTVGMHSPGEKVTLNLHRAQPFVFDLQRFIHQEMMEERTRIAGEEIGRLPDNAYRIIRQHLIHGGFHRSLQAFDKVTSGSSLNGSSSSGGEAPMDVSAPSEKAERAPEGDSAEVALASAPGPMAWTPATRRVALETVEMRSSIRQAICNGRVQNAMEQLDRDVPDFLDEPTPSLAVVMLLSQQVVEFLRDSDVPAALVWLRSKLGHLRETVPQTAVAPLMETAALLAYTEPEKCELGRLHFHPSRRMLTAELVNQAILTRSLKLPAWSPIHVLLRHLVVCRQLLHERNMGRGPIVSSRLLCCPLTSRDRAERSEQLVSDSGVPPGHKPEAVGGQVDQRLSHEQT